MANTPHSGQHGTFSCSECGLSWESTAGPIVTRYCPECGAFESITFSPDHQAPESSERELFMEEIIGWRAWEVAELGKLVRLHSVTASAHWPIADWVYAKCGGESFCEKSDDGRVPGEKCRCGLYAARDYDHLTRELGYSDYSTRDVRIIGQVAMAGKVIEGSQGWKAEKARVFHIYVPHTHWKLGKRLSEQYGVPYDTHRWIG